MCERRVLQTVCGHEVLEGAGVPLYRALGQNNSHVFDPLLQMDYFDSDRRADYVAGFPQHAHRGIETVTWLLEGTLDTEDSFGQNVRLRRGDCLWIGTGSGVIHREMPRPSRRMRCAHLWLNQAEQAKMAPPWYRLIRREQCAVRQGRWGRLYAPTGAWALRDNTERTTPQAQLAMLCLRAGATFVLKTPSENRLTLFLMRGQLLTGGQTLQGKTVVLFERGEQVSMAAAGNGGAQMLLVAAPPLAQQIAWGGTVVMSSQEDLRRAFADLDAGHFVRGKAEFV